MAVQHDVVVVGAGPAGVTLANLLGGYGVAVALIDREADVVEEPRAVGIDDEALRTLQMFDTAESVLDNAVRNAPIRYYDSKGRVLAHVAPSERPFGWPRRNLFFQPNLERVLRASLDRFPTVMFDTSTEAVGLEQCDERVALRVRRGGQERTLTAAYVVGADGGRSFVRSALDIRLEGDTAPMKWLVVDVENDTWDAPYSAVYTSPHRPSMTIPLPFGYRRFEFQVLEHEDPDEMVRPERVAELLARFYEPGRMPPAARRRIYWHHSRTAETFQRGRVFLVGDAAHLQPPFFGQGMNSGIRDVTNLAWKLAFVVRGRASRQLLTTYDVERRETARAMVKFATGVGRMYRPKNRATEVVRNVLFRGVQRVPGGRDYVLQMRYKPTPRYTSGFVLPPASDKRSLVGRAFPQPVVQRVDGGRVLLDSVLANRLALLSLVPGAAARLDTDLARRWAALDGVVVEVHVMPPYRRAGQDDPARLDSGAIAVYDLEGGFRDLLLARPVEEVYVVRPDRYVAAAGPAALADDLVRRVLALLAPAS
jgi:3-(3-hydroxy-phenyl)propionate hydroxylase